MKAAGYIRISTKFQIEGTSLQSQEDQIKSYCAMKGLELVEIYADSVVSGSKPLEQRPAGGELIAALASKKADAVIVCKLDRAFRNTIDCLINAETWEKQGVSLHVLNLGGQTIDTGTPTGKFFLTLMAGVAELERAMINERSAEGRKVRKSQGCRLGEIPFGFTVDTNDPSGKRLVEVEEEQSIIAQMRAMNHSGQSFRKIAVHLNDNGIVTKKGSFWTHKQVSSIVGRAVA